MSSLSTHPIHRIALATALVMAGAGATSTALARKLQSVSVKFVAMAGDTTVNCSRTVKGLGTTAVDVRVRDLRFYVSELSMISVVNGVETLVPVTLKGNEFQLNADGDTVALVDLEKANVADGGYCAGTTALHTTITGKLPEGTYSGMVLTLGVPETLNHSQVTTAPAPLNSADMNWSWQSGRKFAKIEINPYNTTTGLFKQGIAKFDAQGNPLGTYNDTYNFHLGNTGCAVDAGAPGGYSCASDNTMTIRFDGFDPTTQNIAVDLKALFAHNNLQEERGGAPGCMSGATDPECVAQWPVLGSTLVQELRNGVLVWVTQKNPNDPFFHGQTVMRPIGKN